MDEAILKIIEIQKEIYNESKNKNSIENVLKKFSIIDIEAQESELIDSTSSSQEKQIQKDKIQNLKPSSNNFIEDDFVGETLGYMHPGERAQIFCTMDLEIQDENPAKASEAESQTIAQVSNEEEKQKENDKKQKSRANMDDNNDEAIKLEDTDPRFLHIMSTDQGADLKRKFFKNTSAEYLMAKCKNLEKYNMDKFCRFIHMGKAMIDYATEGDLKNFKRLFMDSDDKELMYWHVQKGFKAAVKHKKLEIIEFVIEDLDMPLNHEAFDGFLHMFIFQCQEAEMENNENTIEVNRQILRYLVKGFGKENINPMDKSNNSTPLIIACEFLYDLQVIEILVDGGADVNAVNNDNGMPLNIVKKRLKNDPENYQLQDISEYLKRKGAVRDWRQAS